MVMVISENCPDVKLPSHITKNIQGRLRIENLQFRFLLLNIPLSIKTK